MAPRVSSTALIGSILAATLAVGVSPTHAHAAAAFGATAPATAEDPEALSERAVEAFAAKQYDASIALFERAYNADPQPNYLFNIGRVYEEKGELASAADYYKRFVRAPGVDIEARENATARLKVLHAALAEVEPDPVPAEEPEETTPPTDDTSDTSDMDDTDNSGATDDPRPNAKKIRIAGYSLLGVGGAGLIVGGVFGGLALGKTRDADDTEFVDDAAALRRDARSNARVADAMYITGGVLAAAGLVMVLTTLRKGGNAKRTGTAAVPKIGPAVSTGRLGVTMQGRF